MCKEYVMNKSKTNGTEIAKIIQKQHKDLYSSSKHTCFKNVQRRVYDALNVFTALGIVEKRRNYIIYKGESGISKPSNPPPKSLVEQVNIKRTEMMSKRLYLLEKAKQYFAIKKLINRNRQKYQRIQVLGTLKLPVLVVSFKKEAQFEVEQRKSNSQLNIKSDTKPRVLNDISKIVMPKQEANKSTWKRYLSWLTSVNKKLKKNRSSGKLSDGSNNSGETHAENEDQSKKYLGNLLEAIQKHQEKILKYQKRGRKPRRVSKKPKTPSTSNTTPMSQHIEQTVQKKQNKISAKKKKNSLIGAETDEEKKEQLPKMKKREKKALMIKDENTEVTMPNPDKVQPKEEAKGGQIKQEIMEMDTPVKSGVSIKPTSMIGPEKNPEFEKENHYHEFVKKELDIKNGLDNHSFMQDGRSESDSQISETFSLVLSSYHSNSCSQDNIFPGLESFNLKYLGHSPINEIEGITGVRSFQYLE
ncbi:unnamed protein product [Moneuplotes crassus]|uniref:E2F/DP family winged-helix DNA-binding domain-containing protein n=1 Tax=Euplotes crassus TaxID=5936 RepID=A0AAD1XXZ1_EUPCR|nr:unnamed protein product [Moneuplotes crassus]